ncbi:MAG: hypothetical protein ACLTZY_09210 [Alistipes indistinctus]
MGKSLALTASCNHGFCSAHRACILPATCWDLAKIDPNPHKRLNIAFTIRT